MDPPGIEPGFPPRQGGVVPLDHRPDLSFQWTGWESNPGTDRRLVHRSCKDQSPPRTCGPHLAQEVRPGVEPAGAILPPYQGGVLPKHLQTNLASDPGWNRTITFLDVTQASRRWTTGSSFNDQRWESNPQARGSRPRRYSSLRTRSKWRVRELHPAVQAYETRLSTGPPAKLQAPVSNRATGLMKASWAPAAPAISSDQGEIRTPKPLRARRSERRVSTSCTTWPCFEQPVRELNPPRQLEGLDPVPIDERAMSKCVGQELNLQASRAGGLQPVGHANAQPTHVVRVAQAGVEPAHHQGLSLAALPICVPCRMFKASSTGFEPTISSVTGRRALQAAPRGLVSSQWLRWDSNPQHPWF